MKPQTRRKRIIFFTFFVISLAVIIKILYAVGATRPVPYYATLERGESVRFHFEAQTINSSVDHIITYSVGGENYKKLDIQFDHEYVISPAQGLVDIWGTITVPSDVEPGIYNGKLAVHFKPIDGNVSSTIEGISMPQITVPALPNQPPVANAGNNLSIFSEVLPATLIPGTVTDADPDDILQYLWKEGETVLLNWTTVGANGECSLDLGTIPLEIGTHTLTLEVSDGHATVSDNMILTIDNSAPNAAPSGGGVFEINTDLILSGFVSDYDGDFLTYKWLEGTTMLNSNSIQAIAVGIPVKLPDLILAGLGLGPHTLTLQIEDGINNPVEKTITVNIVDTTVPTLAPVADQTILWPPNHKFVDIIIKANTTDNSGLPVTLNAIVSSNEDINGLGDGDQAPDWTELVIDQEIGLIYLKLRAERSGAGNGRIYTITINATDTANNTSTAIVEIIVSHDKKRKQ